MIPVSKPAPDSRSMAELHGTVGGALGMPFADSVGTSQIFAQEIERAVERQGGEAAIDARTGEATKARRAGRHGEFDRYRNEANEAERRSRSASDEDVRDADRTLIETNARDESRGPRRPNASGEVRREAARDAASSRDADSTTGTRPKPESTRSQVDASTKQGIPGQAATTTGTANTGANVQSSSSAKAAVVGLRPVAAGSGASPDGTAAFLNGARGESSGGASGRASAPAPATPDAKLVEHAAEVLKQIRLSLKGGAKEVTVQLSPAELGRLAIKMRLKDGKLTTVIRVESPMTLEMLEKQAPELRAVLAQQGFESETVEFELGFGSQYGGAPTRDDSNARGSIRATRPETQPETTGDSSDIPPDHLTRVSHDENHVDTFA